MTRLETLVAQRLVQKNKSILAESKRQISVLKRRIVVHAKVIAAAEAWLDEKEDWTGNILGTESALTKAIKDFRIIKKKWPNN